MRKRLWLFITIAVVLIGGTMVLASAEDYSLFIDHSGNVLKDVPIQADVKLVGHNAPAYTNVRVKVDISGPGTPKLMATDSEGKQWDIAQIGYWGPESGFAVGGTFTNTTPVTATFSEAGLYEIKLSLVNVTDGSTIASSNESIYVYRDQAELDEILNSANKINNTVNVANNTTNNVVENLPQTGTSIAEYAIYTAIIVAICLVGYMIIRNYKIKL